ncbi:hypothetical protein [Streptomyces sp. BPTC-684]|uniref:hypothetical protein n=1 Tax=Streptomyces sp. BPTC-684 TaxID=3043734 RepID=UPI0024B24AE6|nr:hypothetical protein [Streptomyces sp. BPTC-684]WHM41138.1 hypothetical protein QIY60_32625 [Streptomyces sp. BPTC-684]
MRAEAPRHPVPEHIPGHLAEAFATTRGRAISPHSPYRSGDAVQRHGYAGNLPGFARTGFRGWVVATVGGTVLTGITLTGQEWWEYWGSLHPDGQPVDIWDHCTCCRDQRRPLLQAFYAQQRAVPVQLGLFATT